MKTDLSKYDNAWFDTGKGTLVRTLWYFTSIVFFMNPMFPFSGIKTRILRLFGAEIGNGVVIKPSVNIKYPWKLKVGDHVWIGENVWIDNLIQVTILKNSCISQGAMLLTGNHNYKKTTFDLFLGEISLEDGVWIGAKTLVCPGITCHSHSVLSAGSILTTDMEEYAIYMGNPAKKYKERVING